MENTEDEDDEDDSDENPAEKCRIPGFRHSWGNRRFTGSDRSAA